MPSDKQLLSEVLERHKELWPRSNKIELSIPLDVAVNCTAMRNDMYQIGMLIAAHLSDQDKPIAELDWEDYTTTINDCIGEKDALKQAACSALLMLSRHQVLLTSQRYRQISFNDTILSETFMFNDERQTITGGIMFKRSDDPDTPLHYDTLIYANGAVLAKTHNQPLARAVSAMLRNAKANEILQRPEVNAILKRWDMEAKCKPEPWYFYLTDRHFLDQYQFFERKRNVTSCMSKPYSHFSEISGHPMDVYDNVEGQMLLLLSRQPVGDIETELQLDDPAYPFDLRTIVATKETFEESSITMPIETPFVFGKCYGLERLVSIFYDDRDEKRGSTYRRNDNPLLTHVPTLLGTRFKAIYEGEHLLMPYTDQSNKCLVSREPDGDWCYPVPSAIPTTTIDGLKRLYPDLNAFAVVQGQYQTGLAGQLRAYCQNTRRWEAYEHNFRRDYFRDTDWGLEYNRAYDEWQIAEGPTCFGTLMPRAVLMRDYITGDFIHPHDAVPYWNEYENRIDITMEGNLPTANEWVEYNRIFWPAHHPLLPQQQPDQQENAA